MYPIKIKSQKFFKKSLELFKNFLLKWVYKIKKFPKMKLTKSIIIVTTLIFSQTTFAKSKKNYENGSLSKQIIINEILPNPEGKDSNKEWIELYNSSNNNINLGNWSIENNKSQQLLSDKLIIPAKGFLILEKENLEFTIKNNDETLYLKDFQGAKIDKISFKKSQENKSLSRTKILQENKIILESLWTQTTKKSQNIVFHELKGKIIEAPTIKEDYFFKIKSKENKIHKILFDLEKHQFTLLKTIFTIDKEVTLLCKEVDKNTFTLENYFIKNPEEIQSKSANISALTQPSWTYKLMIPITIITILLVTLEKLKPNRVT